MNVETIGRFVLLKRLSRGAMATVYLGLDPDAERLVAVKVLFGELESDATAVKRFEREAGILRALSHPSMVELIEDGKDGGRPFMVLEHVRGQPLSVPAGGMPVPLACARIKEIARGLSEAHARGIVHRDLKPENLLIEERTGTLKILDFGVARAQDQLLQTTMGAFLGTRSWAAPEQLRGEDVDARADLYAFGLIAYLLLTGQHAVTAADEIAGLEQQRTDAYPPPSQVRPGLPAGLDPLILRLLKFDANERYARADDFLRALEVFEGQCQLKALSSRTLADFPELMNELETVSAAMHAGDLEQALVLGEALAAKAPGAAEVFFLLGEIHVERGFLYQGIQAYTKATVLQPENLHYHLELGLAFEALEMFAPAKGEYRAALALDPESTIARQQLELLEVKVKDHATREQAGTVAATSDGGARRAAAAWRGAVPLEGEMAHWRSRPLPKLTIVLRTLGWWGWASAKLGQKEKCAWTTRAQLAIFAAGALAIYASRQHGLALPFPGWNPLAYPFQLGCTLAAAYVMGSIYLIDEALVAFRRLALQGRVIMPRDEAKQMTINLGSERDVQPISVFNVYREKTPGSARGKLLGRMLVRTIGPDACTGDYQPLSDIAPEAGDYAVALDAISAGLVAPESATLAPRILRLPSLSSSVG